ncbi:hypothetical protein ACFWJ5_37215 [Streptomyces qaidamensis]|uniref:hypothetical protein n=1 Tax=Streptomyces qaidamensis TaxID=1783515 RepID=UPI003651169D
MDGQQRLDALDEHVPPVGGDTEQLGLELRIAFEALARRLPELRLATPADQIRTNPESIIYGVHELPVTW